MMQPQPLADKSLEDSLWVLLAYAGAGNFTKYHQMVDYLRFSYPKENINKTLASIIPAHIQEMIIKTNGG